MAKYLVQHRRGTVEQWAEKSTIIPEEGEIVIEIDEVNSLHKLKIGDGQHAYSELAYLKAGDEIVTQVLAEAKPRIVTVELGETWVADTDGRHYQQLYFDNITKQSRLDLQPDAEMLAELQRLGVIFVTVNQNGHSILVYSVGNMPSKPYRIQATIVETECQDDRHVYGIPVGASHNPLRALTYAELVLLRHHKRLVPGAFYRITDYMCTTTQENTRSAGNAFDIIVQALSNNTLSESALADCHMGSRYLEPSVFDDEVILSAKDRTFTPGAVEFVYTLWEDSHRDNYNGRHSGDDIMTRADMVHSYDFLMNNQGEYVPVIYRIDPKSEYGADIGEPFYYIGTEEIESVVYDKWRKIEQNERIAQNHFTWTSAAKYYAYTNRIVKSASASPSAISAWQLKYCLDNDTTRFAWAGLAAPTMLYPLSLEASKGGAVTRQPLYDGRWADDGPYYYAWGTQADVEDGDRANFVYSLTEFVQTGDVVYDYGSGWSCVAQMASAGGKGVIYWMKDEKNNECSYDFKNIQFRQGETENYHYTFSDSETGTEDITTLQACDNYIGPYRNRNVLTLNNVIIEGTSTTSNITVCPGVANQWIDATEITAPTTYKVASSTEVVLDA